MVFYNCKSQERHADVYVLRKNRELVPVRNDLKHIGQISSGSKNNSIETEQRLNRCLKKQRLFFNVLEGRHDPHLRGTDCQKQANSKPQYAVHHNRHTVMKIENHVIAAGKSCNIQYAVQWTAG